MSEAMWIALITLGGPAVMAGTYRLWRDHRADRRAELKEARESALTQARLEAVAREAQAALEAKNVELNATKAERDDCAARLADCLAARRGAP